MNFMEKITNALTGNRSGRTFQETLDCQSCPEATNNRVEFPRDIWEDVKEIRKQFLPNEMAIFLVLEKLPTKYVVKDYMIPKQHVARANVEVLETGPSEIIGHLHSHGTFGAFFSGVDRAHFNYDIQMVIGSPSGMNIFGESKNVDNLSVVCVTRTKTSCNRVIQQNAMVDIIEPPKLESEATPTEYGTIDNQPETPVEEIHKAITKAISRVPLPSKVMRPRSFVEYPVKKEILPIRTISVDRLVKDSPQIVKHGVKRDIKAITFGLQDEKGE
jgi:proteasome lid subunit RPN8/RPN11